uniref:Uncharacterized protein n=1 Tax=Ascaris lumbricoides TaxID=6252 RepID=A0A0M3IHM0_ASCLU
MISSMPAGTLKPQNRATKILINNNTTRKNSRLENYISIVN